MSRILRVNNFDGEPIGAALSVHSLAELLEDVSPSRYHIDEIGHDLLPSGHTSRRWGVGTKHPDGTVTLDPDPWPRPQRAACGRPSTLLLAHRKCPEPGLGVPGSG